MEALFSFLDVVDPLLWGIGGAVFIALAGMLIGVLAGWRKGVHMADVACARAEMAAAQKIQNMETKLAEQETILTRTEEKLRRTEKVDEEESYALEWRNRYLVARVKYLESQLADENAPDMALHDVVETAQDSLPKVASKT